MSRRSPLLTLLHEYEQDCVWREESLVEGESIYGRPIPKANQPKQEASMIECVAKAALDAS